MSLPFTKIRDVDLKILQMLDDHELYDICELDDYARLLCKDENFWRNRFISKFSRDILGGKPDDMTWEEYYIELANDEELSGKNKLYYISPSAKLFFKNAKLGEYLGQPLNVNLIETAGVSSKRNLEALLNHYRSFQFFNYSITDPNFFADSFDIEMEKLKIKEDVLEISKNISRLVPLLLRKPLRTDTLLYSKLYNLYNKEEKILKLLNII